MSGEERQVERRLSDLSRRLARVEQRLDLLERRAASVEELPAAAPGGDEGAFPGRIRTGDLLPLLGRALLILAGAFLLRAVTEIGFLTQGLGTTLGMGYAVLLILLADRAAGRSNRTGATFYGVVAAVIGYPLLWEATVKFDFLSPVAGVACLTGLTALALLLAFRRSLGTLAWVFCLAAASLAVALGTATKNPVLFSTFLLLLGVATLWIGYLRGWLSLAWSVAAMLDLAILFLGAMFLSGKTEQVVRVVPPPFLVFLQLAMVVSYLGSFAARAIRLGRPVGPGEILQGSIVMAAGLGGAMVVIESVDLQGWSLGVVSALLAAACYATSFFFIERSAGTKRNFIFFTTLAMLFMLVSLGELLHGAPLTTAYAAAGLLAGWTGELRQRATLSLHAAVYVAAAALTSGLVTGSAQSLVEANAPPPDWISLPALIALAAAAACCWFEVPVLGKTWGGLAIVSKLACLAVLALGLGGIAVSLCALLLPADAGGITDRALLGAVRTLVLSLATLTLSWIRRWRRFAAAAWLVYPLLITGGVKLLLEDVRTGRPSTLVGSLICYGGALILAPRIARR